MERLSAASLGETLDLIGRSDLIQAGGVNLISLDAIRDRAGVGWNRKKELVWEFTERQLRDRLAPGDLTHRVTETLYLVATAHELGLAAQGLCMRVLEAVLLHFIGRVEMADIAVFRVEGVQDGALTYSGVDVSRIPKPEESDASVVRALCESPIRAAEKTPLLFSAVGGRALRVDFAPQVVASLVHGAISALYMDRLIADAETGERLYGRHLEDLTDGDMARIDGATLDYAGLYLSSAGDTPLPVIVPVSRRSLSTPRGRAILAENGAGEPQFRMMAVLEIVDFSPETPSSRIGEVVALAGKYARQVVGRATLTTGDFSYLSGARLAAMTIDFQNPDKRPASLRNLTVVELAHRMRATTRNLIGLGLPNARAEPLLKQLGFTHYGVVGRVPGA